MKATKRLCISLLAAIFVISVAISSVFLASSIHSSDRKCASPATRLVTNPSQIVSSIPKNADIALANLSCANGLPGADAVTCSNSFAILDQWAQRVKSETERHLYRFRANSAEFENSEGYFRMLMMAVVLYEDFGVRYNPRLISTATGNTADYSFFANPRDVFIHGLLGSERMGTCSSMPVLYTAIGRRLGYPLKLVTTKAHLFIRWEGNGERFNLEATGRGMNRYDDEHYERWPFPVTYEEINADGYLKSLTPDEELAVFLSIRGHCLMQAKRFDEAILCYSEAARLAPNARGYRLLQQNASQLVQLIKRETL